MGKMNTVQSLFPHLPERLDGLEELAENLWWRWNPGARMLFKTLDRQAWKESGHNPDKMLREVPRELLEKAAAEADYLRRYDAVPDVFHIPHEWIRLMKESIKSNAAAFSARRMVKQYIEKFYAKSMEGALKA
jgi:glucan phosphorylase